MVLIANNKKFYFNFIIEVPQTKMPFLNYYFNNYYPIMYKSFERICFFRFVWGELISRLNIKKHVKVF